MKTTRTISDARWNVHLTFEDLKVLRDALAAQPSADAQRLCAKMQARITWGTHRYAVLSGVK